MLIYKSLKDVSYEEIARCFNIAFSDYNLPLQLTEKQIQTHFEMSGVNKELSYGAFLDNEMVGFIFNSCNIYNEEKVVFDAGTGVVPEQRGKGVFTNLFNFNEQELQKYKIKKYYLEVLQQNNKAIEAYKKNGFDIVREFSILKATNTGVNITTEPMACIELDNFKFSSIEHCNLVKPSYEHSTNVLKINPNCYNVALREKENKVTAFCVFSKVTGSIVQLGYTDIEDLKIIIEQLLLRFKDVTIKNIDINYSEVLNLLHDIGFHEITKQFEMSKKMCN